MTESSEQAWQRERRQQAYEDRLRLEIPQIVANWVKVGQELGYDTAIVLQILAEIRTRDGYASDGTKLGGS